nr:TPA_asm: hypothetical protein HUJ06_001316 [Nelumbo nucifera]
MGRKKLKIWRLESMKSRKITYVKRKAGLMKKAHELSILCDVDLVLLMFSPTGSPTLVTGEKNDLSSVVQKLSNMTLEERLHR